MSKIINGLHVDPVLHEGRLVRLAQVGQGLELVDLVVL